MKQDDVHLSECLMAKERLNSVALVFLFSSLWAIDPILPSPSPPLPSSYKFKFRAGGPYHLPSPLAFFPTLSPLFSAPSLPQHHLLQPATLAPPFPRIISITYFIFTEKMDGIWSIAQITAVQKLISVFFLPLLISSHSLLLFTDKMHIWLSQKRKKKSALRLLINSFY